MSSTSERSSEETFLCSICLEVFSEPVATPCGHNFCKRCICQTWDTDGPCTCPLCKRRYYRRPELSVNTLLREVLSESKLEKNKSRSMEDKPVFKEVQCDFCSEPKLKALKSCMDCLSSFCETHLQPHLTVSGLKRHQLVEPVEKLENRLCPKHQRPLELFCATDEKILCLMCFILEHKNHDLGTLEEACERRRSSLLHIQAQNQHMVQQRRLKVQEIQRCMKFSDIEVHRERACSVQTKQDQLLEELQEKQSRSHKRAQELVQQLEQEICELEKNSTEAERLSRSQDPLHFLQRYPALKPPAGLKEWSSVSFDPECQGSAFQALAELHKRLSEEFQQQSSRFELIRVQKFAVDVTLDPDVANSWLVLSEDLKQVYCGHVRKQLPDSPLRFEKDRYVLGKQSFSSGRFYFEVQVKGNTDWGLGVALESISRKGPIQSNEMCSIWYREYRAAHPIRAAQKVGVFVDYDEGRVSFYDADSAVHLRTYIYLSFREKLFPFFSPCWSYGVSNSVPLVLTAVETFRGVSH